MEAEDLMQQWAQSRVQALVCRLQRLIRRGVVL